MLLQKRRSQGHIQRLLPARRSLAGHRTACNDLSSTDAPQAGTVSRDLRPDLRQPGLLRDQHSNNARPFHHVDSRVACDRPSFLRPFLGSSLGSGQAESELKSALRGGKMHPTPACAHITSRVSVGSATASSSARKLGRPAAAMKHKYSAAAWQTHGALRAPHNRPSYRWAPLLACPANNIPASSLQGHLAEYGTSHEYVHVACAVFHVGQSRCADGTDRPSLQPTSETVERR